MGEKESLVQPLKEVSFMMTEWECLEIHLAILTLKEKKKLEWLAEEYPDDVITLPKGSIKKLIGRELSWEDDCVEIKDE